SFVRPVSVLELVDLTNPSVIEEAAGPALVRWPRQTKVLPSMRVSGMLEHTAEHTDRRQGMLETAPVLAANDLRATLAHDRPRFTRMGHHRRRPRVVTCVPCLIPHVNVG